MRSIFRASVSLACSFMAVFAAPNAARAAADVAADPDSARAQLEEWHYLDASWVGINGVELAPGAVVEIAFQISPAPEGMSLPSGIPWWQVSVFDAPALRPAEMVPAADLRVSVVEFGSESAILEEQGWAGGTFVWRTDGPTVEGRRLILRVRAMGGFPDAPTAYIRVGGHVENLAVRGLPIYRD